MYRKRMIAHFRSGDSATRRTAAERLMELLVGSGTVYTSVWVSEFVVLLHITPYDLV